MIVTRKVQKCIEDATKMKNYSRLIMCMVERGERTRKRDSTGGRGEWNGSLFHLVHFKVTKVGNWFQGVENLLGLKEMRYFPFQNTSSNSNKTIEVFQRFS